MSRLWLIALRNLAQHRRRTALLGGAIASVTLLLVMLLGLSNGIRETLLRSATTLLSGHVNVAGFFKVSAGQAAPVITEWPKLEAIVRREVPEVDYITERGRGWAKLISETQSVQVSLGGLDVQRERGLADVLEILSGHLQELSEPKTMLLFEDQAKRLEVRVGDVVTISAPTLRGVSNTLDVRVVAIARNIGLISQFSAFVNGNVIRELYQLRPDASGALQIYLKNLRDVPQVQERLRTVLAKEGFQIMDADPRVFWQKFQAVAREPWTGQKLDVTTWQDEISFMKWTVDALNALSFLLIFVLLVIISVGIMNTLWIAIRERTREIGTLRALGMQRSWVLMMFVLEGFLLGLISAGGGAVLGLLASAGVNALHLRLPVEVQLFLMADTLHLSAQPLAVLGSIALITTSTTLVSLIPSFLAARMRPVTAMHHLG
jgi:ABC-type lipoprotein release transport system permease subunit